MGDVCMCGKKLAVMGKIDPSKKACRVCLSFNNFDFVVDASPVGPLAD
jgi:hypothetical protein